MNVPEPLEITASLMAGYRFDDGSLIEVDYHPVRSEHEVTMLMGDTARIPSEGYASYRITDASGEVIASGDDFLFGTTPEDYGEIMDDLAGFLRHDAELWEGVGDGHIPEPDEWIFPTPVVQWAFNHEDELSILACYRED